MTVTFALYSFSDLDCRSMLTAHSCGHSYCQTDDLHVLKFIILQLGSIPHVVSQLKLWLKPKEGIPSMILYSRASSTLQRKSDDSNTNLNTVLQYERTKKPPGENAETKLPLDAKRNQATDCFGYLSKMNHLNLTGKWKTCFKEYEIRLKIHNWLYSPSHGQRCELSIHHNMVTLHYSWRCQWPLPQHIAPFRNFVLSKSKQLIHLKWPPWDCSRTESN